jgi:hypothetical protein
MTGEGSIEFRFERRRYGRTTYTCPRHPCCNLKMHKANRPDCGGPSEKRLALNFTESSKDNAEGKGDGRNDNQKGQGDGDFVNVSHCAHLVGLQNEKLYTVANITRNVSIGAQRPIVD